MFYKDWKIFLLKRNILLQQYRFSVRSIISKGAKGGQGGPLSRPFSVEQELTSIALGMRSWMLCQTIEKYKAISERISEVSISSLMVECELLDGI
jgi:hypothetical protein